MKIKENVAYHCKTIEDAERLRELSIEQGCEMHERFIGYWNEHKEYTCYSYEYNRWHFSPISLYQYQGYEIIDFSTPTIEEVREYFKNAKEVKCLYDDRIVEFEIKALYRDTTSRSVVYCTDLTSDYSDLCLYQDGKYAEIVSYKEEEEWKPEYGDEVEVFDRRREWKSGFTFGCEYPKDSTSDYRYVCFDSDGWCVTFVNIRKPIPTITQKEAEDKLKELGFECRVE